MTQHTGNNRNDLALMRNYLQCHQYLAHKSTHFLLTIKNFLNYFWELYASVWEQISMRVWKASFLFHAPFSTLVLVSPKSLRHLLNMMMTKRHTTTIIWCEIKPWEQTIRLHEISLVGSIFVGSTLAQVCLTCVGFTQSLYHSEKTQFQTESLS